MEKIIKILVVFALLMFIVLYSVRTRERKYRDYFFSRRIKRPLPVDAGDGWRSVDISGEIITGDTATDVEELQAVLSTIQLTQQADALLFDPASRMLYCYRSEGFLIIFKISGVDSYKELQRLAVPENCDGLALDSAEDELYLHAGGELFVFSK